MSGRAQHGRGRGPRGTGGRSSSSSRMESWSPMSQPFEFRPRQPGQSSQPSSVPETGPSQRQPSVQFPDEAQFFAEPHIADDNEPYYNLEDLMTEHYIPPPGEEEENLELEMTFEELLSQRGRADRLIVLDPDCVTPGSKWLGHNDPGSRIVRCFTNLIKGSFRRPYYSWKWVSTARRDKWLYDFAHTYHWDYAHHERVKAALYAKAAVRLCDLVSKARRNRARKRPEWIGSTLWTAMCLHWDTEGNKAKSQAASSSRLSTRNGLGISRHVGGSKPFTQHGEDMEVELGRRVTPSEVFVKTHTKDGQFIDLMAKKIDDEYQKKKAARLSQLDPELDSDGRTQVSLTPEQEEEVFLQSCHTLRDGRFYGLGNLHRKTDGPLEGSSSRPAWSAMHEELQKSQEEIAALKSSKTQQEQIIAELQRKVEARERDDDVISAFIRADPRFQQFAASYPPRPSPSEDASEDTLPPPQ